MASRLIHGRTVFSRNHKLADMLKIHCYCREWDLEVIDEWHLEDQKTPADEQSNQPRKNTMIDLDDGQNNRRSIRSNPSRRFLGCKEDVLTYSQQPELTTGTALIPAYKSKKT